MWDYFHVSQMFSYMVVSHFSYFDWCLILTHKRNIFLSTSYFSSIFLRLKEKLLLCLHSISLSIFVLPIIETPNCAIQNRSLILRNKIKSRNWSEMDRYNAIIQNGPKPTISRDIKVKLIYISFEKKHQRRLNTQRQKSQSGFKSVRRASSRPKKSTEKMKSTDTQRIFIWSALLCSYIGSLVETYMFQWHSDLSLSIQFL